MEVCLDVSEDGSQPCVVRVSGVLADGREMECQVDEQAADAGAAGALPLVGCTVGDGQEWWVKGKLKGGNWLLSRGEGYDAINSEL